MLGIAVMGCATRSRMALPAAELTEQLTDPGDFIRTTADLQAKRQRLYVGLGGNGVFLGPSGDAAPAHGQPNAPPPIAFGDFWREQARVPVLSLSLTPGPNPGDSHWQVLDIDTGRATTSWEYRLFPLRRGRCRVETVVTPEGTVCWQVNSTAHRLTLSIETPLIGGDEWDITESRATARTMSGPGEAIVSLYIRPAPEWSFAEGAGGQGRREILQADLGQHAFISLVQQILPPGESDELTADSGIFPASFEEASESARGAWSTTWPQCQSARRTRPGRWGPRRVAGAAASLDMTRRTCTRRFSPAATQLRLDASSNGT
jgi:hypothetical protein